MEDYLIAITGDKGGVGKTTIAVLITEWLLHQGLNVRLTDADPTQNTQTWADKCAEAGRTVSSADAPVTVVDTAGTSGASLNKYIRNADLIIVPFQPHVADLETVVGWYLSLRPELQERVAFVPNRLENTLEQREGIAQLEAIIVEEGRGKLLSGLRNRPAVYPPLLNGSTTNFFDQDLGDKVKEETNDLLSALTEGIAVAGRV